MSRNLTLNSWGIVSPGYFDLFKVPLIRGRLFSTRDSRGALPVAIISETLARRFFPRADDDTPVSCSNCSRDIGGQPRSRPMRVIIAA